MSILYESFAAAFSLYLPSYTLLIFSLCIYISLCIYCRTPSLDGILSGLFNKVNQEKRTDVRVSRRDILWNGLRQI